MTTLDLLRTCFRHGGWIGGLASCALVAACGNGSSSQAGAGGLGGAAGSGVSETGGRRGSGGTSASGGAGAGVSATGGESNGGGGSSNVGTGGNGGTGAGIGRYTVFERDVPFDETGLANVWEDVTVTAVFTSPSKKAINVRGFYHSTSTWKVRFAPSEIGTYSYHVVVTSGAKKSTLDGSFDCVASSEKGFVRASTSNPFRLVFEGDGSLYPALGMGNCFGDPDAVSWGLDGGDTSKGEQRHYADGNTYFTAMAAGKLNVFRWSVNNCAPDMWETIAPSGNKYLAKEALWGDTLVRELRQHGFRVYMDFFGWKPAYTTAWQDQPSMDAVKRYVDYIVARYGAYVDFWEVCNESSPPGEWITLVAKYVESIDPYQHMVSASWERPDLAAIGITSPHWYEKEAELDSDTRTIAKIDPERSGNKPIIFGEQGNSVQNWDPLSSLRARIRAWTAFFDEGHLIFWDQQGSKNYMAGAANLYIGAELRKYFAVLQTFTSGISADVKRTAVTSAPTGAVRAYGLSSSGGFYVYLRDAQSITNTRTGVTLQVSLAKAGTAKFYDTLTGSVLATQSVAQGSVTLSVPSFVTDVALAVTYAK